MAIMMIVMIGILSTISYAYTASTQTEQLDIARRIASYTVEYLRARTVVTGGSPGPTTTLATTLGITSTGMYGWYRSSTDPSPNTAGAFPSMIDTENLPIQSDGMPCNYFWSYVQSHAVTTNQGSGGGIAAGGSAFQFSSMHPALSAETFSTTSTTPLAWTSTLQGYVSVRNRLPDDVTSLAATQNPAPEDSHLARLYFNVSTYPNNANGCYRTTLTDLTSAGAWTGLIVQYPGIYPAASPAMTITSFTPGSTYLAKVYTTDTDTTGLNSKVSQKSQEYNPYYTNVSTDKAKTQDYRGFRVLTQVIARTADRTAYNHVQYYDVQVTVFWVTGTRESQYGLTTQIIAY
jgi:hypothetical protein